MTATKYSLNLSKRYVADWGAWEVAREIICNALDAAPDDLEITPQGADTLIIRTPTVPDLSELFIMGEGTKAAGGDTIGQFGEGLKLAALVATRSGGNLTLDLPTKRVMFSFEEVMGVDVLHAEIVECEDAALNQIIPAAKRGYIASIHMTGICAAYAGRILEDRTAGPQPKHSADGMTLYFKGVFVAIMKADSLWNWNVDKVKLNRDRSMVEDINAKIAIGQWLQDHMTPEMADRIVAKNEAVIENGSAIYYRDAGETAKQLPAAFLRLHGDNACVAIDSEVYNRRARNAGREVVEVPTAELRLLLTSNGIDDAGKYKPEREPLVEIDIAPYAAQIAKLRTLDAMIAAPQFSVCVYESDDDKVLGRADRGGKIIWLSNRLFSDGNDLELARTYLHESAHIMSMAEDCTREFESSLDDINGRLAMHILGGSK